MTTICRLLIKIQNTKLIKEVRSYPFWNKFFRTNSAPFCENKTRVLLYISEMEDISKFQMQSMSIVYGVKGGLLVANSITNLLFKIEVILFRNF